MTDLPLTRREGRPPLGGPYEGVPEHLRQPLLDWVIAQFMIGREYRQDVMDRLMAAEQIPAPKVGSTISEIAAGIVVYCVKDEEHFLDVINTLLRFKWFGDDHLEELLSYGRSVWRADASGLVRRVPTAAQDAYEQATAPEDTASRELDEAWTKAYGRDRDPSDAWDHAIKAVEAVLIPIVVPRQDKPQLGHVLGALDRQGQLWRLGLPRPDTGHHSVAPLVAMLRLLWPNPDRHGDPGNSRTPTIEEARAVVHLAVTIAQWGRDGLIVKR